MSEVRPGSLLLATPSLVDPHFADTVVLVLDVDAGGSLGVVLNRPTDLPVAEVLEQWSGLVAEPEVLFEGGPVEANGALALVLRRSTDHEPDDVLGLRDLDVPDDTLFQGLALLDLDTPVELVAAEVAGLRIFAGYAGWGAGQLDREIEEGSWYVVPGAAPDAFRADTSTLWRDVLRRQPGGLAWLSTRPADVDLN
ncbi:YqgE/AlgH family protein [Nocardioides sp. C4-1]|uniref:YqgE/AlgH family protein n=1 Tax=Nocardioides sp. C4-1 TaxID=3151851 RepID=UPI0032667183